MLTSISGSPPIVTSPSVARDLSAVSVFSCACSLAISILRVVHVPSPRFADDAPYATAVVDFGPTRLTGIVRDAGSDREDGDAAPEVAIGDAVTAEVGERATDGERLVVFRPAADERRGESE